uniref:Uncharacterized protein n=1 Tax=Fagus sylvatica TaxID=28930 RepID=A0A2N9HTW4_FAGSY
MNSGSSIGPSKMEVALLSSDIAVPQLFGWNKKIINMTRSAAKKWPLFAVSPTISAPQYCESWEEFVVDEMI